MKLNRLIKKVVFSFYPIEAKLIPTKIRENFYFIFVRQALNIPLCCAGVDIDRFLFF